jgi:hypothetical protein
MARATPAKPRNPRRATRRGPLRIDGMHRANRTSTPSRISFVQPLVHVMSPQLKNLYRVLCLALAVQSAGALGGAPAKVGPSDCKPRDADSTCATAVVGAPVPDPPAVHPDPAVYSGLLGGVPSSGYAYWGWDFLAEETGMTSPVRQDAFINRSKVPVTITLSFNIPTTHPCNRNCLPGMQFFVNAGWDKVDPPYVVIDDSVSLTATFKPGQGYGWIIALWQSTNPRLIVTVPHGSTASLSYLGLPKFPGAADEISAATGVCGCWDGSSATCSFGGRYSNGLLGPWFQNAGIYQRLGAFNDCPIYQP